ncbi:MAG: cell wall-binding repeat-containing protein, partial [Actinobacteria bacterium]|nr:cell wall-binding repeat-containing protein [Actinomycetota bacterium]
ARQDVYADALAGAPLAFENHAPMLLTTQGALASEVKTELERLRVDTVYLLGGEAALSPRVEQDLQAMGIRNIVRIGGIDRFETAAMIGERLTDTSNVYIVEGADPSETRGWPDALSVAPLASVEGRPILLVTTETLPEHTRAALDEFGAESATVIGGPVAVNDDVRAAIEDEGVALKEVFGDDRYDTSAKLADIAARTHLHDARPWLATGEKFPDALSAGSAAALNGGPLLLVPHGDLGAAPASEEWLREHSPDVDRVRFLGGPVAISANVEAQVKQAIAAGPPPAGPTPPLKGEELASFTFETGPEGWTTSTNKITTRWQVAPPGDASGQSFQIPVYDNESTAMLTSPAISHTGGPVKLQWSQRTNSEEGFDFLNVEWSVGGELYHGLVGFSGMNESYPQFDPHEIAFEAPPGDLYIRFRFSSDQLVNQEGVYVDNVVVSN